VSSPVWDAFVEKPIQEFEPRAPAAELAAALERYHTDMDAAAHAAVQSREQGLRALAELAVLIVELEQAVDRCGGAPVAQLQALTDQMLAVVASTGLEIVRLRGLRARESVDLVEVESWRYDDSFEEELIAEELEVAVLHLGRPLRRGRVVMGVPPEGGPEAADDSDTRQSTPATVSARHVTVEESESMVCPVTSCGFLNPADSDVCIACLTHLVGYRQLTLFPQVLFNRGLRAARAGDPRVARDHFATAITWAPDDTEIRHAYALACLQGNDEAAARRAWEEVLARVPTDTRALRGLSQLSIR
jgi:hypothetical protein